MNKITILWVDDEIDMLKPHILFLEDKKYSVVTCKSGQEALEEIEKNRFDIVFLDENMPGLSGLETLTEIKNARTYPAGSDDHAKRGRVYNGRGHRF